MRQTIAIRSPLEKLAVFNFSESEVPTINWYQPIKEFFFDGKLYDIVRIERNSDGSLTIFALNDEKENAILTLLKSFINNNKQNNLPDNHIQHFIKYISNLYFLTIDEISIVNPSKVLNRLCPVFLIFKSFICEIPSPPPKLI
jgi:hypothetical protein